MSENALLGELRVLGKGQPGGPDAARAVEAWLAIHGDDPGAPLRRHQQRRKNLGRRISGDAIHAIVGRLVGRASIATASPHDLRRSFATSLLEAGEDLATVAKAMGK